MRDTVVDSGGVPIAVYEHGGTGTPLLLLHGGGGNLAHWQRFAPLLTDRFRVVSMDLRGHGRSGAAPWSTDAVLADIENVLARLELRRPVLVGQSLGGMLAGIRAARHPECPAAVSLDGHRAVATHPRCYADMPAEQLDADLARLRQVFDAMADGLARPLDGHALAALTEQHRGHGFDEQQAHRAVTRGMEVRDGQNWARPDAAMTATLRDAPDFLDVLPHFAETRAPLLVVLANQDLPGKPPEFAPLMRAFRAGLRRDLAAIDNPLLSVRELDASHGMVFEQPAAVAELVTAFIERQLSSPAV